MFLYSAIIKLISSMQQSHSYAACVVYKIKLGRKSQSIFLASPPLPTALHASLKGQVSLLLSVLASVTNYHSYYTVCATNYHCLDVANSAYMTCAHVHNNYIKTCRSPWSYMVACTCRFPFIAVRSLKFWLAS